MTSLTESKTARISTLCALYFAQGFPWGFMTTALVAYLAKQGLTVADTGHLIAMAILPWTFKLIWARWQFFHYLCIYPGQNPQPLCLPATWQYLICPQPWEINLQAI